MVALLGARACSFPSITASAEGRILLGHVARKRGTGALDLYLDPTRLFSLFDEEIELDARGYAQLPGTVVAGRGREVAERFCREYWGTWTEYSVEPLEFIDAGDHVVVEVQERGKGKGSGVPFERTNIQVWTIREGRLVRWLLFADRAEALEAAGLSR